MRTFELQPPADDPEATVEACATRLGLGLVRFHLKKYPGASHWHFTMPGQKGTLECTWWPSQKRLWLAVHSNRAADWHAAAIAAFERSIGRKSA